MGEGVMERERERERERGRERRKEIRTGTIRQEGNG